MEGRVGIGLGDNEAIRKVTSGILRISRDRDTMRATTESFSTSELPYAIRFGLCLLHSVRSAFVRMVQPA